MRPLILAPLVAAVILGGCNSSDQPKSEEQVKEAMAKAIKPKAGLYRSTSKLISFEVPGMPAAQAEKMKSMFSSTQQGREYCMTAEQAEGGFEQSLKSLPQGKCSYDRFTVEGNQLDSKLSCETGKGMTAKIEMKGTVGEDGTQLTMSINQSAAGMPDGGIKMVAEVASQRIGDCPAG